MGKLDTIKAPLGPVFTAFPQKVRVLVMEDQLFDLTRLRRLVATLDVVTEIESADSLSEMRRLLTQKTFDLILIDHVLADGTGLEALEAVQTSQANADAATVFVTEAARADIAMDALKRGCGDFLCMEDLAPAAMRRAAINAFQKAGLRAILRRTKA